MNRLKQKGKHLFLLACILFAPAVRLHAADVDTATFIFREWIARYRESPFTHADGLIAEGATLAGDRRNLLINTLRTDPQTAIGAALTEDELLLLPTEIRTVCERHVDGLASDSRFVAVPMTQYEPARRDIVIRGQTFAAYVYGSYLSKMSFQGYHVSGIAVGPFLAVESPQPPKGVATLTAVPPPTESTIEFNISIDPEKITLSESDLYTYLSYPGCDALQAPPGSPTVPCLYTNVCLPRNAIITGIRFNPSPLQTLRTNVLLYPTQPPSVPGEPASFVPPNPTAYESADTFPPTAGVGVDEPVRCRTYAFVPLRINPFQYIPSSRTVLFHNSLSVTITYCQPPTATMTATAKSEPSPLGAGDAQFLVITSSSLASEFQRLADVHAQHAGLSTAVVTMDWIVSNYSGIKPSGGTDIQTKIRECITDYFHNKGTTLVLLGGDDTIVPVRDCYVTSSVLFPQYIQDKMPTDLYYAGLDGTWDEDADGVYGEADYNIFLADEGDLGADVWVGRIPVATVADAAAYVDKVDAYYTRPPYFTATKLLIGGNHLSGNGNYEAYENDNRPSDVMMDGYLSFRHSLHPQVSDSEMWGRRLFRDVIQPIYTPNDLLYLFDTLTSLDGSGPAGTNVVGATMIQKILNLGCGFFLNISHGSVVHFSTEEINGFSIYNIGNLNSVTPVVYSASCNASNFDSYLVTPGDQQSLSEFLLSKPSAGCLVFLGSSRTGFYDPDPPPADNNSVGGPGIEWARKFCGFMFSEQPFVVTAASALYNTKQAFAAQSVSNGPHRWNQFAINLLGDPALQLIRHVPPANVSVEGTDAVAGTTASDTAEFTIWRNALSYGDPLTVYYEVTGSAVAGQDYSSFLSGHVTIPKSQTSATIQIEPIVDDMFKTSKDLILHLRRDPGWIDDAKYMIADQATATALIQGNVTVSTSDGNITIEAYTGPGGDVIIPATINGLPVTTIGNNAFQNSTNLTSVTIPYSVTTIKIGAFSDCSSLTSITVAGANPAYASTDGVLFCKDFATLIQYPRGKTETYAIPNSVTTIGNATFKNCTNLTSVTIPDSVTTIGNYTFAGCSGLTSLTIPDSVITIGGLAFARCYSLTDVTIPANVTTIGPAAFQSCTGLTSLTLQNDLSSFSLGEVFMNCNGLKNLIIGDNAISIGNNMFGGRSGLTNLVIGASVTTIGDSAFSSCSGLTSVTIPDSVTTIGSSAFYGCSGLTNLVIGASVISLGSRVFFSCSSLTSVAIPDSVTTIGDMAFSYCSSLTSLTLHNDLSSFRLGYVFYECFGLRNLTVGNNVTTIGNDAFSGRPGLTNLVIGTSVTTIGDSAFSSCSGLTSVTIPDSVTTIGSSAFYGCSGLTNLVIGASVISLGSGVFSSCSSLTNVVIPDSVTSIGYSAFFACNSLTSVTIPSSVISIGSRAFFWCSGLTSVTIPSNVTTIGDEAFHGCSGLTSVTIPDSVTTIGDSAFSSCSGLTNVTIGSNVITIDNLTFGGCSSLKTLVIGSGVTNIRKTAFNTCYDLQYVYFIGKPPSVENSEFDDTAATIYYLPNFASSWPSTFGGRPTLCWNPTVQSGPSFGFSSGQFGFNVTGTPDIPVRVEFCTNLTSKVWSPVQTTTLGSTGAVQVSDPDSDKHPQRFYRITFPQ